LFALLTSGVLDLLSVLLAVRRLALRRAQDKSRCSQEDGVNGQAQERANTLSENQYTIDTRSFGGTFHTTNNKHRYTSTQKAQPLTIGSFHFPEIGKVGNSAVRKSIGSPLAIRLRWGLAHPGHGNALVDSFDRL